MKQLYPNKNWFKNTKEQSIMILKTIKKNNLWNEVQK